MYPSHIVKEVHITKQVDMKTERADDTVAVSEPRWEPQQQQQQQQPQQQPRTRQDFLKCEL